MDGGGVQWGDVVGGDVVGGDGVALGGTQCILKRKGHINSSSLAHIIYIFSSLQMP